MSLDWGKMLEQEPRAALGDGGLGRLAACSLRQWPRCNSRPTGCGLRFEYGIFKQWIPANVHKIYAESLHGETHSNTILSEAQVIVDNAMNLSEGRR